LFIIKFFKKKNEKCKCSAPPHPQLIRLCPHSVVSPKLFLGSTRRACLPKQKRNAAPTAYKTLLVGVPTTGFFKQLQQMYVFLVGC